VASRPGTSLDDPPSKPPGGANRSSRRPRARQARRRHDAVRDITFATRRSKILGFLGPTRPVKRAIVKTITGVVVPTHGAVIFQGHPIDARFKEGLI
jgi:ABC-type uncharacterized transport system ATPase subunit